MTHRMLGSGWSRCLMLQRKKKSSVLIWGWNACKAQ